MGFGGSVASMIASLRSNKRARETIFENKPTLGEVKHTRFPTQEVDPTELRAFREKVQKAKRRSDIKVVIILGVFFTLSLLFFLKIKQVI
ncbi:MAG TPA: hypothetical protein DCS93_11515 [Microscillaceae bacterium]|nr:hypothetical protein [Microscillaceae bacterium]